MKTYPAHLQPKNIIKAFNKNIGQQELMERAAAMHDKALTAQKIKTLNTRWAKQFSKPLKAILAPLSWGFWAVKFD